MMKKMCSLLLGAAVMLTTMAQSVPVLAVPSGTNTPVELVKGNTTEFTASLANEDTEKEGRDPITNTVDNYFFTVNDETGTVEIKKPDGTDETVENKPAVEMDQGQSFWVGFRWNFARVTGDIHKITGVLDYDKEQFETIEPGDLVVNGDSGDDNDVSHTYLTGWDNKNSTFSIEGNDANLAINVPTATSGAVADATCGAAETGRGDVYLMVKFTVKESKPLAEFHIRDLGIETTDNKYYTYDVSDYLDWTVVNKWESMTRVEDGAKVAKDGSGKELRDEEGKVTSFKLKDNSTKGELDGRNLVVYTKDQVVSLKQQVSIPVYIQKNTGFNTLHMWARYDSDELDYESVSLAPELRVYADLSVYANEDDNTAATSNDDDYTPVGPKIIRVSITATKNINLERGAQLIQFNFKAKKAANVTKVLGHKYKVLIDVPYVGNAAGNDASMNGGNWKTTVGGSSGSINPEKITDIYTDHYNHLTSTITLAQTYSLGDVNNDGKVNLVDAAMLLQFYNGVRVLDENLIEAGKINHDNKVTLVDVLLIMKYYNTGTCTSGPAGEWRDKPLTPLSDIPTT